MVIFVIRGHDNHNNKTIVKLFDSKHENTRVQHLFHSSKTYIGNYFSEMNELSTTRYIIPSQFFKAHLSMYLKMFSQEGVQEVARAIFSYDIYFSQGYLAVILVTIIYNDIYYYYLPLVCL